VLAAGEGRDEIPPGGRRGRLAARLHAQLAQDRRDVVVDGSGRKHQLVGNVGVAHA